MPPSKNWKKKHAENFHSNAGEPVEPVVKDNSASSGRKSDRKKVEKGNSSASSPQQAPELQQLRSRHTQNKQVFPQGPA
ncbi:hypothetical protein AAF712_010687 [Marasmius tenuissimus]|uniref:Uncharacterized protein n=1 Tax=Marasmius tenuissimus TaxID=585030 RepID=A0ABR2ZLC0_9AGAR